MIQLYIYMHSFSYSFPLWSITVGPCCLFILLYNSLHLLIPNYQSIPPPSYYPITRCIISEKNRLNRLYTVLFFYMTSEKKAELWEKTDHWLPGVEEWDWLQKGITEFSTVILYLDCDGWFTTIHQKSQNGTLQRVNFSIHNHTSINLEKKRWYHFSLPLVV